jgi:hypothetical protein
MGCLQSPVTANYYRALLVPSTGQSHFKIQLLATWSTETEQLSMTSQQPPPKHPVYNVARGRSLPVP